MQTKWTISSILLIVIVGISVFLLGFNNMDSKIEHKVYNVYLDGDLIGTIESKEEFEEYINEKEEQIKKQYNIDTVYTPNGVEIKEIITYNPEIKSNDYIYQEIIKLKKFTIKGVIVNIDNEEKSEDEDKEIKEDVKIYVLNKEIFDEAINNTVKAFVSEEEYNKYMESKQEEIKDTGSMIENIDIEQKITYKESLISTDEKIFTDVSELAKYLLYGTTETQQKYIVKQGDTIETVSSNNKLNVQEFLIANPEFTSVNNLLYESQEVVVGLINPIVNVVVDYHTVEDEERSFDTEIQYDDNQYIGYEVVSRNGENGLYRVTRKKQYLNGQLVDTTNVSSSELKPAINKVVVKGGKYAPSVADLSYWAWPTERPYVVTSGYAWRWGEFHNALDIAGTGYGSAIYAANNGVVERVGTGCSSGYLKCNGSQGNFVLINHNIGGYYTIYMHLKDVYVTTGQTVARGQKIGTMGNSGNVYPIPTSYNPYAGTHLHFGVYVGSAYGRTINPYNLY